MGEAAGESHGGHVNCRHLGSHHGFNFVLRANTPHHRQHKVRSPFVGCFPLRTDIGQLGKQSVVKIVQAMPLPSVRAREAILPIPLKSRPYFDLVDRFQRCRKGKG